MGEGEEPDGETLYMYGEFILFVALGGLALAALTFACQRLECFWTWKAGRRLSTAEGVDGATTRLSPGQDSSSNAVDRESLGLGRSARP